MLNILLEGPYSELILFVDKKQMISVTVKYKDWGFEVDKELTEQTYKKVSGSEADTCTCHNCKNHVHFVTRFFQTKL